MKHQFATMAEWEEFSAKSIAESRATLEIVNSLSDTEEYRNLYECHMKMVALHEKIFRTNPETRH